MSSAMTMTIGKSEDDYDDADDCFDVNESGDCGGGGRRDL